jgi:signal transduction histidine kinase/ActR/RegA family two-component response regulator
LFRKYALLFAGLMSTALIGSGVLDAWFSFREQSALLARIQQAQAEAAAEKIGRFVGEIEQQMVWATQLPWTPEATEARRREALRLLRLAPAITELTMLDAIGREQLALSRLAGDRIGLLTDHSKEPAFVTAMADKSFHGPVTFRYASEPYMTLAIAGTRPDTGVTMAEVNLKFIWDVVSQMRIGTGGLAYVTDASGRLIAHPNISMVLSNTNFSGRADGRSGVVATATVAPLNWHVFVELPVAEAYAPLYSSLYRSIVLLIVALALAAVAGWVVVRRMVGPIEALRAGAEQIGSGKLGQRLVIKTGDELEVLGEQFNAMAAQLEHSYATLERKVDERTHQLALANTAQRRFLSVASHDLRQPLYAMGLFVEQLRSRMGESERERVIDRACAAVANLNELFDALLDLSQLDAGTLTTQPADFPIGRLFKRLEATFASAALESGLDLRIVASKAWVRSDPILLERILLNLVSNAVRHTRAGGVVVGCRRRGETLRIEVWDSGPGIPAEQRDKIFDEFVRLQPNDTGRPRGLGLGLAIVQRLCELLRHRLLVESIVGKGSRFSLSVPVGTRDLTVPGQPGTTGQKAGQTTGQSPSFEGQRVAVIDDDPTVLESLGGLLQRWGCLVTTAATTTEVLTLLAQQRQPPNLVIADYSLSGGANGVEAIHAVRARFGAEIPAFLISADATSARVGELSASGLQLLRKPTSPVMLRALMLSALGTDTTTVRESRVAKPKV